MSSINSLTTLTLTPDFETKKSFVTVGCMWSLAVGQESLNSVLRDLPGEADVATPKPQAPIVAIELPGWMDGYLAIKDVDARQEHIDAMCAFATTLRDLKVRELLLPFDRSYTPAPPYEMHDSEERFHRLLRLLSALRIDLGFAGVRCHLSPAQHGYPATPRELRQCVDEANSPWIVATAPGLATDNALPHEVFDILGHRLASVRCADAEQLQQALTLVDSASTAAPKCLFSMLESAHQPMVVLNKGNSNDALEALLSSVKNIYAQSGKIDPQRSAS